MELQHIRQIKNGVMAATVGDQAVVMGIDNGRFFDLNPMGAVIWSKLDRETTFANIVSELMAMYDVDEVTCKSEVTRFLTNMKELGFVEAQSTPW
jgi:hypothetical protein